MFNLGAQAIGQALQTERRQLGWIDVNEAVAPRLTLGSSWEDVDPAAHLAGLIPRPLMSWPWAAWPARHRGPAGRCRTARAEPLTPATLHRR